MVGSSITTAFASASSPALCTTTLLPASGILSVSGRPDTVLTLDNNVIFRAPCPTTTTTTIPTVSIAVSAPATSDTGSASLSLEGSGDADGDGLDGLDDDSPHFSDFRDPFFASSFPICYALASTTVTAYMLVIMLFVTPRSFFDSGVVYLGRRGGFTRGSGAGVNIGGRPWLQKVAALTVAISLTIATADTFKIAKEQYIWGVQNAKVLQNEVMGSTELKVIRIISDTFLWLAQAQTLIRLFPRQREKVIIKWAAFALITLDVIFSALNSFTYADPDSVGRSVPKGFTHPVPALGYLFQLSLGVLYAAWVIYYALMKKRYAFYHPLMKNMCLVAIMSLTAIVIPVVFFILDISKPQFTGWGDYVRWVGAAAASVVVWEWVERIERLEREEKKDGILGREVFDGDDTLEATASELPWMRNRRGRKGRKGVGEEGDVGVVANLPQHEHVGRSPWSSVPVIGSRHRGVDANGDSGGQRGRHRYRNRRQHHDARDAERRGHGDRDGGRDGGMGNILRPAIWLARPAPAVTPISRTDTASADSTLYAVRCQGVSNETTMSSHHESNTLPELTRLASAPRISPSRGDAPAPTVSHSLTNSSDLEANHDETSQGPQRAQSPMRSRWDIRARLEEFAANQADKIRERLRPTTDTQSLPVTVIPAPARRGAALQQVLEEVAEEEELNSSAASIIRRGRRYSGPEPGRTATLPEESAPRINPPLWPGVGPRQIMYDDDDDDDDDEYSYDDSIGSLSVVSQHEVEPEPDGGTGR